MVNQGVLADSLGTSYPEDMPFVVGYHNSYAEYFVNQQYTLLKGVAAPYKDISQDATVRLSIYADGELVYSSEEIGRTSAPVAFEVAIAQAKLIRIEIKATGKVFFRNNSLLLTDLILRR
jgi:hypothetical protein